MAPPGTDTRPPPAPRAAIVEPDPDGRLDTVVRPAQLLADGYIIMRSIVRPGELQPLRDSVEAMHARAQAALPAAERAAHAAQWRISIDRTVDAASLNVLEFLHGHNTLGVSAAVMGATQHPGLRVAIGTPAVLCNGGVEHGATDWHRDFDTAECAPLSGVAADIQANGLGNVQWNIALYDDDVFWLRPRSHRTPDSGELLDGLLRDPCSPVPGGIPARLKAGDGVVYTNMCLHWGSLYGPKLRRTIVLWYRSFGGPIGASYGFGDGPGRYAEVLSKPFLPEALRTSYEAMDRWYDAEQESITAFFRAVAAPRADP
eukprot:SAG22_NODE_3426_length_1719_cov_1.109877_2_plen_315_part_01